MRRRQRHHPGPEIADKQGGSGLVFEHDFRNQTEQGQHSEDPTLPAAQHAQRTHKIAQEEHRIQSGKAAVFAQRGMDPKHGERNQRGCAKEPEPEPPALFLPQQPGENDKHQAVPGEVFETIVQEVTSPQTIPAPGSPRIFGQAKRGLALQNKPGDQRQNPDQERTAKPWDIE